MIAILASLISVIWITLLFVPLHLDPDGKEQLVLLIVIDIFLFVLGIVAMILAARRRCSWHIAALIALTPPLHFLASMLPMWADNLDESLAPRILWLGSLMRFIGVVLIIGPSMLILLLTAVQQARRLRTHAKDAG